MKNAERDTLILKVQNAFTLEEINSIWSALQDWKQRYPDDMGIDDEFEMLALQRLCFADVTEPVLVGV